MTVTKSPFGSEVFADGITRQKTSCKIIVCSHIENNDLAGRIDCSNDVINCSTSKSIRGTGAASFTLVPRRNYINYIFPNDYVNIWFDPGDGRGFIRIFFGFVDRVNRDIGTNRNTGATNTTFTIICSDFTKAFDKTNIYFNPHVGDREDFVGKFAGTKNIGGALLRTKGITIFGTPADIVMNLAILMIGYNSQFRLPTSYPTNDAFVNANREFRKKWIKAQMPRTLQKNLKSGTITEWYEALKKEAEEFVQVTDDKKLSKLTGISVDALKTPEARLAASIQILSTAQDLKGVTQTQEFKAGLAIEATAAGPAHLIDLIDFSFIEYLAINGSLVSAPIWSQQGTIWALMNNYSNNIVNELFCDLRPLTTQYKTDTPLKHGPYVKEADEFSKILKVKESDVGVRFVPAIVMREYPFSTISEIRTGNAKILNEDLGTVRIGAIFSKHAGTDSVGGRKSITLTPPLHDYIREKSPNLKAYKHIDVTVISVQDIITESIGRSDNDVVNLLELYADGFMGSHVKYLSREIQPLATPVSILRHGLRVRTYSTKFARYSKKHTKIGGLDNIGTKHILARWVLMLDHWYQHNIEYLNGGMTTRFLPETRIGYRLDIKERRESYYVEGVNHKWSYPGEATTAFTLSRGQRNDPLPVYSTPNLLSFGGDRTDTGRLANVFLQKDPEAVQRAVQNLMIDDDEYVIGSLNIDINDVDNPNSLSNYWSNFINRYIPADTDQSDIDPDDGRDDVPETYEALNKVYTLG